MQRPGRRCFGAFLATALVYILLGGLVVHFTQGTSVAELAENRQWIASSKSWLDRQACRWVGLCGLAHVRSKYWTWPADGDRRWQPPSDSLNYAALPPSGADEDPAAWSDDERARRTIPPYVLEHAPYVHLFSGEEYWPCDIAEHLTHTTPRLNYTTLAGMDGDRTLDNLDDLNDVDGGRHGRFVYLQSDDNVEEKPSWLGGEKNIPSAPKPLADPDADGPRPSLDDLAGYDLEAVKQQAVGDHFGQDRREEEEEEEEEEEDHHQKDRDMDPHRPWLKLEKSTDGRCGGVSGQTCKGSLFGQCCSIFGYCGNGDAYCGASCDPLSGQCADPVERLLKPKPHLDLRRRRRRRRRRGVDRHPDSASLGGIDPRRLKEESNIPRPGGKSSAPAILVVVPKKDGIVDAFWFFFYSYNLGNAVFGLRFGNHVGDWEHTVVRFKNGRPTTVFMSEHNFGEAYAWHAIEKYMPNPDGSGTMLGSWSNGTVDRLSTRPVVYSATGSHAMYGTPGLHPYVLPWGLLHDQTDRGPLWDPLLNSHTYTYDLATQRLRASTHTPRAPVNWFYYTGHWGDKYYPLSDPRQYRFAGQYHYVNGPLGPRFKHLGREQVCQGRGPCRIKHWMEASATSVFPPEESVEHGGLPGGNVTEQAF